MTEGPKKLSIPDMKKMLKNISALISKGVAVETIMTVSRDGGNWVSFYVKKDDPVAKAQRAVKKVNLPKMGKESESMRERVRALAVLDNKGRPIPGQAAAIAKKLKHPEMSIRAHLAHITMRPGKGK